SSGSIGFTAFENNARVAVIGRARLIGFEELDTPKSGGFEQRAKLFWLIKAQDEFFKLCLHKGLCLEELISVDRPANPFLFIIKPQPTQQDLACVKPFHPSATPLARTSRPRPGSLNFKYEFCLGQHKLIDAFEAFSRS